MLTIQRICKVLRPVRRFVEKANTRPVELPYLFGRPPVGSAEWLVKSEIKYGGYVTGVARRRVSPLDGRTPEQLAFGGMIGGDRMLHHGYGHVYARYLAPFIGRSGMTLAEFGILKGTGLAIWCDLFHDANVIGLDIDLGHFEENRTALFKRSALGCNRPELHEYDQLVAGEDKLDAVLESRQLDVVVNDRLQICTN